MPAEAEGDAAEIRDDAAVRPQDDLRRYTAVKVAIRFSFRAIGTSTLPLDRASAVAAIPGGLLLVNDDLGIFRVSRGRAALWAARDLHPALGDLEGLAIDRSRGRVWAIAEESGTVVRLSLRGDLPNPTVVGRLPRPGKKTNKGFEGIAFVPARISPSGRASLVAVHEARPRRVRVFALPKLEMTHDLKLPGRVKELLDDLADVAVDPVTGALMLLSDRSRRIVVVEIVRRRLELRDAYDLPLDEREKPEGLEFVSRSRLLVVSDSSPTLLEVEVRRRRAPRS